MIQMADIPMDEHLASVLISGQYILGYLFSSVAMLRQLCMADLYS